MPTSQTIPSSTIESLYSKCVATFVAAVLPTSCIVCGVFQKQSLCVSCSKILAYGGLFNYECCRQCGITLDGTEVLGQRCYECAANPPHYDETYCLDRYSGVLQKSLHQLKYQKRLAFAHGLAKAWNQFLANELEDIDACYLLPVPLSPQKLCARGFNQSWELARKIHCGKQVLSLSNALLRRHHEQHQASGNRTLRNTAIQGMFYINEKYLDALRGKNIIVFDDVMTSGATLNEIARVLKENGALRVINWVLLRTHRPS